MIDAKFLEKIYSIINSRIFVQNRFSYTYNEKLNSNLTQKLQRLTE